MKKNWKNLLSLGLILLTVGVFILIICLSSDFSDNGGNTPSHETHTWEWDWDGEYHWQYTTCEGHKKLETEHVKHNFTTYTHSDEYHWRYTDCEHEKVKTTEEKHVYDNDDDPACNICNRERDIPTKPDKLDVTISGGEASIGKVDQTEQNVVIPSTVPDGNGGSVPVTSIQDEAFKGNMTLTTIKILDGVKTIGKDAFAGCTNLTRIEIPKTVTEIDPAAFAGCQSLERIIVSADNPVYLGFTDCLIRKADKTIILGCKASKIPERAEQAVAIGEGAFQGSLITEIKIPANITTIGSGAFSGCSELISFSVTESVKELPANLFKDCIKLETVTLHDGITSIGEGAFSGCTSLKTFDVPAGVKNIYSFTFSGCTSLTEVTFEEGFRNIGNSAFNGCSKLTSITLPSSTEGIGLSAFAGCTQLAEIVYKGTEEEWNAVRKQGNNWKPETTQITFSPVQTEPPTEPDPENPNPTEPTEPTDPTESEGGTDTPEGTQGV